MTDHTRTEKIGGDFIYFYGHPSRDGKTEDLVKVFNHLFFERLLINNVENEAFSRNKMHGNAITAQSDIIRLRAKNTYASGLFSKPYLFTKIKLK